MRRVVVVGTSGSGKTIISRALASRLEVPHIELDAVYHRPHWEPTPLPEFRHRVDRLTAGDGWVLDGNYSAVRDLVWPRADTVVWLDLPRRTVMRQVVWRTVRRAVTRQVLWNTNREPLTGMFRLDPGESIILWAWTRHAAYRQRYETLSGDPAYAHLSFVRLRSRRDAARLVVV